jgi:hypothetical protein
VRTLRRPARLALLANLLLLPFTLPAAATAAASDSAPPSSDAVVGDAPALPVANHLPVEEDLANPYPVVLEGVIETADPSTVLLTFWAGPEACTGVQRVEVTETANEVRVGVFLGERSPGQPCARIALHSATTVQLGQPLGERPIIDANAPSRLTEPAAYAAATFAAWTGGDGGALAEFASSPVAALLGARRAAPEDGWSPPAACEGAAGSTICRWQGTDAAISIRVENAAAAAGDAHAAVAARFAPRDGAVALWPLTTAEEAANTQAEVDAGSSPWLVDPATVARFHAAAELGWPEVTVEPAGEASFAVAEPGGASALVSLGQPARPGAGGIWAVTGVASS